MQYDYAKYSNTNDLDIWDFNSKYTYKIENFIIMHPLYYITLKKPFNKC